MAPDGASSGTFLARLSEGDRAALTARLTRADFGDGAQVLSQDDRGADLFVILEGRVSVSLFSADGREVSYRDAGAGDVIGELAAIDGAPRSASVIARGPVTAGRLSQAGLFALCEASPAFARAMMEHLTAQVRAATERVFEVSTLLVRERLLRELVRRARAAADDAGGGDAARLSPAPTHFELAARLSTHREAVSREMSRLARLDLIARRGRTVEVPSIERLAALMDEG